MAIGRKHKYKWHAKDVIGKQSKNQNSGRAPTPPTKTQPPFTVSSTKVAINIDFVAVSAQITTSIASILVATAPSLAAYNHMLRL
jgi:hypothetical protein